MQKKFTAVLIDDEFSALEILDIKLSKWYKEIEVVGKFQNPVEAMDVLPELNPHLLFLDITMPEMNGLDLLASVNLPDTEVIFVTAHNDYALEAIRQCAIGYVIKPIDEDLLKEAVNNALVNLQKKSSLEKTRELLLNLQTKPQNRLVVPTQKGLSILKIEEVVRLEGLDGYTKICLVDDKCIVSSYNIGKFKNLLSGHTFVQLHKSHLVNAAFLSSILNEGYALLSNGEKIPYSKLKKSEIIEIIKNL